MSGDARFRICEQLVCLLKGDMSSANLNLGRIDCKSIMDYCYSDTETLKEDLRGEAYPKIVLKSNPPNPNCRELIDTNFIGVTQHDYMEMEEETAAIVVQPGSSQHQYMPGCFTWVFQNINILILNPSTETNAAHFVEKIFSIIFCIIHEINAVGGLIYDDEGHETTTIDLISDDLNIEHIDENPSVNAELLLQVRYQYIPEV